MPPSPPTAPPTRWSFSAAGLAGLVAGYTTLAEDLASRGYIVVGVDAPYRSSVVVFPDGRTLARAPQNDADALTGPAQEQLALRLVRAWSADQTFVLDRLERLNAADPRFLHRLDLQRVGIVGHSLGGATALQFCHDDSRCKAVIDLDGAPLGTPVADGISQPLLVLLSDHHGDSADETRTVLANIRAIYQRLPPGRRLQLTLRGSNHFQFADDAALLKAPILRGILHAVGLLPLDGRRQLDLTTHLVGAFLDVYLQGASATELTTQSSRPGIEPTP